MLLHDKLNKVLIYNSNFILYSKNFILKVTQFLILKNQYNYHKSITHITIFLF